ncbi:hypothetical protein MKW98_024420 [Papaver atlanticum]|uniref:Transmembrane protein n=1 Tax=Papaver atlanticum TaxID=357466 RepID=A0AAD4XN95_9MAGN|nr:hypothetical protein MKW98_024420 [Papaver atlanticum]
MMGLFVEGVTSSGIEFLAVGLLFVTTSKGTNQSNHLSDFKVSAAELTIQHYLVWHWREQLVELVRGRRAFGTGENNWWIIAIIYSAALAITFNSCVAYKQHRELQRMLKESQATERRTLAQLHQSRKKVQP